MNVFTTIMLSQPIWYHLLEDHYGIKVDSKRLSHWSLYRSVLISTWNQTDFQTHFAPILDLLSDFFDCEQVENK